LGSPFLMMPCCAVGSPPPAREFPSAAARSRTDRASGRFYRERFEAIGWSEHTPYPGLAEVIAELDSDGRRLSVVTAKNEPYARRIVEHLPFGGVFDEVVGATWDGSRSHKPDLIQEMLDRLGVEPRHAVMIGDRRMDIEGARHHGMLGIGVLWGFGTEQELRDAGASHVVAAPTELTTLLS